MEDKNNSSNDQSLDIKSEVRDRESAVGMSGATKYLGVAGIGVITLVVLFYIFTSHHEVRNTVNDKNEGVNLVEAKKSATKVVKETQAPIKLPVKLPELPTLVAPVESPPHIKREVNSLQKIPSIADVVVEKPNITKPSVTTPTISVPSVVSGGSSGMGRLIQNRNTPMVAMTGGGAGGGSGGGGVNLSDPSSLTNLDNLSKIKDSLGGGSAPVDESTPLTRTSSPQVKATYVGDLNIIIAQGKVIDAILETAINTDLKGMLRAIVSRDVYSESGRNILLPKGSRLIGEYSSSIADAQVRVEISWKRVVRPDGVDIQLNSPGTDQLGRAGVKGDVDTKFTHMFLNSFLVSSVKILGASLTKRLFPDADSSTSTSTNSNGITTDNTPASVRMASNAVSDLTKTFETLMKRYEGNKPTIRVPQGARIKVYVQQDLVFGRNLSNVVQVEN